MLPSSDRSRNVTVDEDDAMMQSRSESGDLLSQSMSYLQRVLLGNEQLQFERSGNKDEDSWIRGSTAYSSFLSRQRPLLPYSKPAKEGQINHDDVLTGLSIDPSQYPVSPTTGRGTTAHRSVYISQRAPQSPRVANSSFQQRTSCWATYPGPFSPTDAASHSMLSLDSTCSPRASNSPLVRCARARRGGASARHTPLLRPAPAPACLTPTAARADNPDGE